MPLVDYADSDDSDAGGKPNIEKTPKDTKAPNKPAFQKVVDHSNPRKVRVSLPELSKSTIKDSDDILEPPLKRAKVGSVGFSDFNSILPAPKRAAASTVGLSIGSRKGGLGNGVNLKTGATQGFSREAEPVSGGPSEVVVDDGHEEHTVNGSGVEDHKSAKFASAPIDKAVDIPSQEPTKQGSRMMFKPLSVARKPQRKKKAPPADGLGGDGSSGILSSQQPSDTPRASLFPIGDVQEPQDFTTTMKGEYKPMVYKISNTKVDHSPLAPSIDPYQEDPDSADEPPLQTSASHPVALQSLNTIATDLRLSTSAKRQLFGRSGNNPSAINIVNFNTDQEYAANEVLRQNGEQVQHNPVRALAAGKHSLKQLVNAASNQKDALEEQFASGRRNKREAGSKYGW